MFSLCSLTQSSIPPVAPVPYSQSPGLFTSPRPLAQPHFLLIDITPHTQIAGKLGPGAQAAAAAAGGGGGGAHHGCGTSTSSTGGSSSSSTAVRQYTYWLGANLPLHDDQVRGRGEGRWRGEGCWEWGGVRGGVRGELVRWGDERVCVWGGGGVVNSSPN